MHAPASLHIYDITIGCWTRITTPDAVPDEHTPMPRSFHTATFVKVDNEPYLFVVGGLHMRTNRDSRDRT